MRSYGCGVQGSLGFGGFHVTLLNNGENQKAVEANLVMVRFWRVGALRRVGNAGAEGGLTRAWRALRGVERCTEI